MLPLLIGGPLVGFLGKMAFDAIYGDDNNKALSVSPVSTKTTLDRNKEQELLFVVTLQWAAISCNGELHDLEDGFFSKMIEGIKEKYRLSESLGREFDEIRKSAPKMKDLRERFSAVKANISVDEYEELIHRAVSADRKVDDIEKSFLFKVSLMLRGLNDIPLYKYSSENPFRGNSGDYLKYVDSAFLKSNFPLTNTGEFSADVFLTPHPGNNKKLIPIEEILSEEFAVSRDTELISAARLAGARFVEIENLSKDETASSDIGKVVLSASASNKFAKINGALENSDELKNIAILEKGETIRFEFEGRRPSRWRNWFGLDRRSVLRSSKWIKFDPVLVEFVNSCFGENRARNFVYQISCRDVDNVIHASFSAVSAGLIIKPVKAAAKGEAERKVTSNSEKKSERMLRYKITF